MSKPIMVAKQAEENDYEFMGLKDGGHVYFVCSNCDAPLLDIWVTLPSKKNIYEILVGCPHCGDHSNLQKVNGNFHIGPMYKDNIYYTQFSSCEEQNGKLYMNTEKVNDWK